MHVYVFCYGGGGARRGNRGRFPALPLNTFSDILTHHQKLPTSFIVDIHDISQAEPAWFIIVIWQRSASRFIISKETFKKIESRARLEIR